MNLLPMDGNSIQWLTHMLLGQKVLIMKNPPKREWGGGIGTVFTANYVN